MTTPPIPTTDRPDDLDASYEVLVLGGGAAGLNAALMLTRSRRSVAVVDAGSPRNAPAAAVHGLLGHEGLSPLELVARGRREVRAYGGHVVEGSVARAEGALDDFTVTLTDGRTARARRLVVATGTVDELPDVAGLADRWGHDVLHCPYCHGYEVRDQAIGVLATGPMTVHQALLFRQLTDDVVVLAHTAGPDADQRAQLAARDIRVVDGTVTEVVVTDDRLTGVRLADGTVVAREAVVVATRLHARLDGLDGLGLTSTTHPSGLATHLATDPMTHRTDVPGVWAVGNVAEPMAQVGASAAAGAMAGAQVNADLVMAEAAAALAAAPAP